MILICYDGSADARAAVEHAARLSPDEPATVLTVWEPFVEVVARSTVGFGLVPSVPDTDEMDKASRTAAEDTAAAGAKLADELGMTALTRTCAQATTTARAILAEAARCDPLPLVCDLLAPIRRPLTHTVGAGGR
jgi:hypothetical protein